MSAVAEFLPLPSRPVASPARPKRLGRVLLDIGAVAPHHLLRAVAMEPRLDATLADILLAEGWVTETDLLVAQSRAWRAPLADLDTNAPCPLTVRALGIEFCLAEGIVPLAGRDGRILLATARPERFADIAPRLDLGALEMALIAPSTAEAAILSVADEAMAQRAEMRTPEPLSCRGFDGVGRRALILLAGLVLALIVAALAWPGPALASFLVWTTGIIALQAGLKVLSLTAAAKAPPGRAVAGAAGRDRLPRVSVLIALRHEPEIAPRLIARLDRLDYPRALLDVLLITEADDAATRAALTDATLPGWMRQVTVPPGTIRTKPRALNYALPLAKGRIVGVYDAEDAPAPDQIRQVVARFRDAPPQVACVQCALDYYHPRTNWLSRCFTAEYAGWFRVVLPGLARLGLVVPLGGTSVFLRRGPLERLGAWDAHNVTEDADLGLRLARAGFRTEVIDSVTEEEPNCRFLPWVRQRSRWLKGYAMTWRVHMRDPVRLWRDLGAWRFFGVQLLFLGTLSQFLLAPLLWLTWLAGPGGIVGLAGLAPPILLYIVAAAIDIAVTAWAVRGPRHRHLWPWLPTLILYFPLATLAAWKGVAELARKPFYWDKTRHGVIDAAAPRVTPP